MDPPFGEEAIPGFLLLCLFIRLMSSLMQNESTEFRVQSSDGIVKKVTELDVSDYINLNSELSTLNSPLSTLIESVFETKNNCSNTLCSGK